MKNEKRISKVLTWASSSRKRHICHMMKELGFSSQKQVLKLLEKLEKEGKIFICFSDESRKKVLLTISAKYWDKYINSIAS